jgi:two-component system, OmpR family, sensor kinase
MSLPWRAIGRVRLFALDLVGLHTSARESTEGQGVSPGERQLIRDAIHALRNPLTVCRWQLELITDDPEERRQTIAVVRDELERMERLLDDLGVLTDADEPDFLRREHVDLELFAHELLAQTSAAGERDWRLDRAEGAVVADAHRLGEAVLKLADNAVQHTEEQDVVAIGACLTDDEARIWVRDTGSGISPADQARILDSFARGADAHRRYRGGGLGLAVVNAIAKAHGGRVELVSRVGEGSTFTIVIPVEGGRARRT